MLFYFSIVLTALIISTVGYLLIRRTGHGYSAEAICGIFSFLSVASGVIIREFIYIKRSGDYFFMNYDSRRNGVVVLTALLIDAILFVLIVIVRMLLIRCHLDSVAVIKGKRIIPIVAVRYLAIISMIIYSILSLADSLMPQFAYWRLENNNINRVSTHVHCTIDEHYNEYEYPFVDEITEKVPDEKRILVLGDSYIWGDGSANVNNLWWKKLQRKLDIEGYENCKVIAVGKNGASTQDQLYWINETNMISDIDPDMIVFGYVTNDAQYIDENGIMIPGQWSPDSYVEKSILLRNLSRVFPNVTDKMNDDLCSREINSTDRSSENLYAYSEWEEKIISGEYLERYLNKTIWPLKDKMDELDIPFCFITTPSTPSKIFEKKYEVLNLFEEGGISVYDCLPDFVSNHGGDSEYNKGINPVNGHPGVATNAYLADYSFRVLENYYKEVLGNRSENVSSTDKNQINDWYPAEGFQPLLKEDGSIQFNYSDSWAPGRYLYLPMFEETVKMCFEYPIDMAGRKLVITDESGNIVNYLRIWTSYIGDAGYEIMSEEPLKQQGDGYSCDLDKVTSLNVGGNTDGIEHSYRIEIK